MNCEAAVGQVLNGGSNFEISIGDTVRMIAELMGAEIEVATDAQRLRPPSSEVDRLFADNSRLRSVTGWTPDYAGREGFRAGLAKTIDWFVNPENLATYKVERYNI